MTVLATCINKNRKNNNIISYTLKDINGQIIAVSKEQLKSAMEKGFIDINNIKLSKDGRIVDREESYYRYMSIICPGNAYKKYVVLRMKKNGTINELQGCHREAIELGESEFYQAVSANFIYIDKKDREHLLLDAKMFPITPKEFEQAYINEEEYWVIMEQIIEARGFGAPDKTEIKIKNILANDIPRDKALAFCKMSIKLHNKLCAEENGKLSLWWTVMQKVLGYVSEDAFNDICYGFIGLGKEAFYDFYKNPTSDCFKKYSQRITKDDSKILRHILTWLRPDLKVSINQVG